MNRLLIGVVVVLVAAVVAQADDAEDKAVKWVKKLGGGCSYDSKKDGQPIVGVYLWETGARDDDLKELAAFKNLTHISLRSSAKTWSTNKCR